MHRERKRGIRDPLGVRKVTALVSKVAACGLQMQRERIMNSASDIVFQQGLANRVALLGPNHEQMVDGLVALRLVGQRDPAACELFAVGLRELAALAIPRIELLELRAQHRGLNRIETRVVADLLMRIVRDATVIAQRDDPRLELVATDCDRTALTPPAEVF